MHADVAQRQRAQQGVAERVDHHVAVGMREHAAIVRYAHAAHHHVVALAEGVHVVTLADAEIVAHRSVSLLETRINADGR